MPGHGRRGGAPCNKSRQRFVRASGVSSPCLRALSQGARAGRPERRQCRHRHRNEPEEDTMNTTTIASRLQSLAAAVLMTLVMLSAIDHLAAAQNADGVLAARTQAAERA